VGADVVLHLRHKLLVKYICRQNINDNLAEAFELGIVCKDVTGPQEAEIVFHE
jgi:hypothetical protein